MIPFFADLVTRTDEARRDFESHPVLLDAVAGGATGQFTWVNLGPLPRISFDPGEPSRFRGRKQPKPECLSTIEAIHRTIDLLPADAGVATNSPRVESSGAVSESGHKP